MLVPRRHPETPTTGMAWEPAMMHGIRQALDASRSHGTLGHATVLLRTPRPMGANQGRGSEFRSVLTRENRSDMKAVQCDGVRSEFSRRFSSRDDSRGRQWDFRDSGGEGR